MRILQTLLLFMLVAISVISGCAQNPSLSPEVQAGGNRPQKDVSSQPDRYQTKLIFIKQSGEHWLAVDERGVVHRIGQIDPHLTFAPGTVCDAQVTVNSAGEYKVEHDYPYSASYVLKLKSSFEEAPYAYAKVDAGQYPLQRECNLRGLRLFVKGCSSKRNPSYRAN